MDLARKGMVVMDADLIRSYVDALAGSAASEVHLKSGDLEIRLCFAGGARADAAPPAADPAADTNHVTAAMPGVVYLAPAPGQPGFAPLGARVAKGDTLMLIEAMKSMQPLTAPCDGIVAALLVGDEDSVTAGQTVLTLRPVAA